MFRYMLIVACLIVAGCTRKPEESPVRQSMEWDAGAQTADGFVFLGDVDDSEFWEGATVANNFPNFDAANWYYQSETSNIERRISAEDYPSEEVRVVQIVTMYQDCNNVSLQGSDYIAFKNSATLERFARCRYQSKIGAAPVTVAQVFSTAWTKISIQAVADGSGGSRVTLAIRRALPWETDPNTEVEP